MNNDLLSKIAKQLNIGGLNYSVFLKSYCLPINNQCDSFGYIRQALGSSVVAENIAVVSGEEVIEEVERSISYPGIEGSGPASKILESSEFNALRVELISELRALILNAKSVQQFRLIEGHPAYPVFWDFAFLFVLSDKVVILIGSSSD